MLPDALITPFFVVLMAVGFGALVFIHEMGHFLAARWARVRVTAFAIGFGRPLLTYRKGLGVRRASTEREFAALAATGTRTDEHGGRRVLTHDGTPVSYTEYRLNALPFGGYVKMMGQDDLDPTNRPDHPDSYVNKPAWKRAVILLGGVVANVILAAVLFVFVYLVGITEPAPIVGGTIDGSPAAAAGIEPGSTIVSVGGVPATSFTDVIIGAALHTPGRPIDVVYRTPDGKQHTASLVPEDLDEGLPYREVGLRSATSTTVAQPPLRASERSIQQRNLERANLPGVPTGTQVTHVNGEALPTVELQDGTPAVRFQTLQDAVARAYDADPDTPIALTLTMPDGSTRSAAAPEPTPGLSVGAVAVPATPRSGDFAYWPVEHLLGMTPLMAVGEGSTPKQGLEVGDVITRVGPVLYPDPATVIETLRDSAGRSITLTVRRGDRSIELGVAVDRDGRIGFAPTTADVPILARTPRFVIPPDEEDPEKRAPLTPFERVGVAPPLPGGVLLQSIAGTDTPTTAAAFRAARDATAQAHATNTGANLDVTLALLEPDGVTPGMPISLTLELTADDVADLHGRTWNSPDLFRAFEPLRGTVRADGPVDAVAIGARRTWRALQQTYLTLQRILQNTVPANQIQGPVGITHTGSVIAEQGLIYMLLILALISANLAVVNLIPIPINDGGQLVLLAYEAVRGKPLPLAVQSVITLAGLGLVVMIFLFVTFNDVMRIVGGGP